MKYKLLPALIVISLTLFLASCTAQAERTPTSALIATPAVIVTSPPPNATLTPVVVPTETATPTPDATKAYWETWLAERPRDMEYYGLTFDPQATPRLPPIESVNWFIWGDKLPLRAFSYVPRFIAHPPDFAAQDVTAELSAADCSEVAGSIECATGSPLNALECEWLIPADKYYPGLKPGFKVLARCMYWPEDEEEARDTYLFRAGCAFRMDNAFILEKDGGYIKVKAPYQVKGMLLPIDSREKALTYLEMMTGLKAVFSFEADPMLLYFIDPLEGTQIQEEDGVYTATMYQYAECSCEPWVDSQVRLSVDREGNISWLGALPFSMSIGFGCAD